MFNILVQINNFTCTFINIFYLLNSLSANIDYVWIGLCNRAFKNANIAYLQIVLNLN